MFIITFSATADSVSSSHSTNGCTILVQADNEKEAERVGRTFLPLTGSSLFSGRFSWLWKMESIERLQKGDAFVGRKLPSGSTAC